MTKRILLSFVLLAGACAAWSAGAPVVPHLPGYRSVTECRDENLRGPASQVTSIGSPRGPVRFIRHDILLKEGVDYRFLDDSSVVLFPDTAADSTRPSAGRICIVRYTAPALPNPVLKPARLEDVPVLRPDIVNPDGGDTNGASGAPGGVRPDVSGFSSGTDTGGYALALSGSKSLAVTAGEGGALGVDAALFVNVNGQVAKNVWIEGSLSDQNTPVQPEGSTTTLREVDVKYLRVYGRQYEYLLGDYLLTHGREGEDRYAIQAEGARLRYGENRRGAAFTYARSKGLFHSDTLRGVDGKQSGYYLRGRDGRTFITVLAGTERLWRNGKPLKRGIDYVIDYAQGRIDFLSSVWVTGENLFFAEFQYTEDSFPRIVLGGEANDTVGNFRLSVRAIQETEDERHPAAGYPDPSRLSTYRNAGDGPVVDSLGAAHPLPERRAITALSGEWEGGEAGKSRFTVLGSLLDRNLYSGLDDDDNLGWSSRYTGIHRFGNPLDRGGVTRLILEPDHTHRSHDFSSFQQAIEPRAFRDAWNLDAAAGESDFDANRVRLTLEPYSGWQIGGGVGAAAGRLADTNAVTGSHAVSSRRGEAFARLEQGATRAELGAETKRALDPYRRDNDRQHGDFETVFAGWLSRASVVRDAWWTETAGGTGVIARSELWQPRLGFESPALNDRWVWSPEADALVTRSDYGAALPALRDSLIDLGFAQRLRLLEWGPVTGDLYVARRHQRVWRPDGGGRSEDAETAVYDQAEANVQVSNYLHGYGAQMHYRAARTSETPLVEAYERVEAGRGDYLFDSLLNAWYRVESGGDHVRIGLVRDSLLGTRPYQDLQWSARIDLSPGKWPAPFLVAGGVLSDVDFTLDLETNHQDSSSDPVPLPRFTDAQIEAVRSGRARYEPSLLWNPPPLANGLGHSASLRYRREYAKGAGLYAFRERGSETRAEYRRALSEWWEAAGVGVLESRRREGLAAGSSTSFSDGQRGQVLVYRRLPYAFTVIPSLEYRHASGEDAGFPLNLHGWVPRARVEKGGFFGGRASAEYAAFWLFGTGEGGYFVTDGYRRGVTHRFEAVAQSEVRSYLHVNANYLARRDPGMESWSQRFSAEVRAVF